MMGRSENTDTTCQTETKFDFSPTFPDKCATKKSNSF